MKDAVVTSVLVNIKEELLNKLRDIKEYKFGKKQDIFHLN